MKSRVFVNTMLGMCGVANIDDIDRTMITEEYVQLMTRFLPKEADELLIRLFREADVQREAIHLCGESEEFVRSKIGKISRSAGILISRIISSQGQREVDITKDGVVVTPCSSRRSKKQKLQLR